MAKIDIRKIEQRTTNSKPSFNSVYDLGSFIVETYPRISLGAFGVLKPLGHGRLTMYSLALLSSFLDSLPSSFLSAALNRLGFTLQPAALSSDFTTKPSRSASSFLILQSSANALDTNNDNTKIENNCFICFPLICCTNHNEYRD